MIARKHMTCDRQNAAADSRRLTLVFSRCYLETGLKGFFHFRQDPAILFAILTEDSNLFLYSGMISLFLSMIESAEGRSLFEHVYYEYRGLMHSIAMGILNDYHLAEDAVSEAFWRIARNFERLTGNLRTSSGIDTLEKEDVLCPEIKAYAVIVVKNVSLSKLKKQRRHREVLLDDEAQLDEIQNDLTGSVSIDQWAEDIQISREKVSDIASAIDELSETLRHTMYLYIVLEFSIEEISDILGIDYETVKKRIQRGREKLQRKVGRI